MTIINLRDSYPFYTMDYFIEVPDEVAAAIHEFDRREAAYRLRTYRHKALKLAFSHSPSVETALQAVSRRRQ